MPRKPLLIDVDTGVDDAMALGLALTMESHELVAVTTVAGNVPVETATQNTLRVLSWLGAEIPVYRGMSQPLSRKLWTATEFHGDDGLGGWEAPTPTIGQADVTAPEAIVRLAREYPGRLTCAFVGPLTNLAVALSLEPRLPELIENLVIMGGAFFNDGNVTEHAEFNVFVDPEAAVRVAASRFNATWIGLDVTHQTMLSLDDWKSLAKAETSGAVLVREVCRHGLELRGRLAVALHDPLAVAVVGDPDLIETDEGLVTVDLNDEMRGRTRLAWPTADEPRHKIGRTVDVGQFEGNFKRLLVY